VARFAARLEQQRITLALSKSAREALAEEGYDPVYGARPLKRAITRELETPVSRLLLAGTLQEGQTLEVDHDGDHFSFIPRLAPAAEPTGEAKPKGDRRKGKT